MKKFLAVLFAALLFPVLAATPASAAIDSKEEHRQESHAAFLGTLYFDIYVDMYRNNNGTPNNNHDDKINFGTDSQSGGITRITNTYTGFTYCSGAQDPDGDGLCYIAGFPLSSEDVTTCTIKILKQDANGNYFVVWENTYNDDGNKAVYSTWMDWDRQPKLRVTCSYTAYLTNWSSNKTAAWVSAWE